MDQQDEVTCAGCGQSEHPNLHTIVELPRVDCLDTVLGQVVADCAQVEAQLTNVLETQLVANRSVKIEQIDDAVLANAKTVLHLVATSADLRLPSKFVVDFLHNSLE